MSRNRNSSDAFWKTIGLISSITMGWAITEILEEIFAVDIPNSLAIVVGIAAISISLHFFSNSRENNKKRTRSAAEVLRKQVEDKKKRIEQFNVECKSLLDEAKILQQGQSQNVQRGYPEPLKLAKATIQEIIKIQTQAENLQDKINELEEAIEQHRKADGDFTEELVSQYSAKFDDYCEMYESLRERLRKQKEQIKIFRFAAETHLVEVYQTRNELSTNAENEDSEKDSSMDYYNASPQTSATQSSH